MNIKDYIDTTRLEAHVNNGYVTVRSHPRLPLLIYCYGRKAVYENTWDEVTCKTRGLIVDSNTGEIVARPFEKFFAYGVHPSTHPLTVRDYDANFGNPLITEKLNGCIGTLWTYGMHWGIASKGSFQSPHALWATKWMEDHVDHNGRLIFPTGYTPVFEIIAQTVQPHCIPYEKDEVVLLALVHQETGEELDFNKTMEYAHNNGLNHTNVIKDMTLDQALKADDGKIEGYVATYNIPGNAPLKIKIKFPSFMEKRKVFYAEIQAKKAEEMELSGSADYEAVHAKAAEIIKEAVVQCTERHEFVAYFNKDENKRYRSICLAMLDTNTKKYQELIWKLVEKNA